MVSGDSAKGVEIIEDVDIGGGCGVNAEGVALVLTLGKNDIGLEESRAGGATGSVGLDTCEKTVEVVFLSIEGLAKSKFGAFACFACEEASSEVSPLTSWDRLRGGT